MRGQTAEQIACALRLVEVQHGMQADIGFGPTAQDQRLDVVEIERNAVAAESALSVSEGSPSLSPPCPGIR
jgi:hypothetical protein